jgi:hypothetical protein
MVKKKPEAVEPEIDEPMTADELMMHLLEDLIVDNEPSDLASEFIDEFVLRDRVETPAILAMLDAPTGELVEMVKAMIEQSYLGQLQAVDERGERFLESLKAAVKSQMQELAED